jgi:hypothetical protein
MSSMISSSNVTWKVEYASVEAAPIMPRGLEIDGSLSYDLCASQISGSLSEHVLLSPDSFPKYSTRHDNNVRQLRFF